MHQQPLSLAGKYAETLNTQNIDLFDTFIANDYVNHNPSVAPGLHGAKEFFAGWLAAFPDTTVIMEDASVEIEDEKMRGRVRWFVSNKGIYLVRAGAAIVQIVPRRCAPGEQGLSQQDGEQCHEHPTPKWGEGMRQVQQLVRNRRFTDTDEWPHGLLCRRP